MVRPARFFQVVLSWAGLITMFAVARRTIGDAWAAAWALVITASYAWLSSAATLTVEPLFFSLAFIVWYWMCVREWDETTATRHWLVAGLLFGLAYWFKASVILLGASVVLAIPTYAILQLRGRPSGNHVRGVVIPALLVVAGFALVTWPLLLERAVAKGNPFFLDSAPAMWMDHWEQHHILFQGLGEFSFEQWFRTHTIAQAWERLSAGMQSQLNIASVFFHPNETAGWLGHAIGALMLGLAVRGGFLLPNVFARIHTFCFLALAFGSLSWNIHTQTIRLTGFLAPVVGFLAVLALRDLLLRYSREQGVSLHAVAWHNAAVGSACVYLVAVLIVGSHVPKEWPPSPRESVRVSQSYAALGQWMVEHIVKPGAVAFQTPYLYPDLQLHWLLGHDELFVNIPLFQDFRQVDAYAAKRGARYLVIAKGTSLDMRRFIFEPYAVTGSDSLSFALPGWRPVAEDPSTDRNWIVYESVARAAADATVANEQPSSVSRSTLPTRASVPPG